MTKAKLKREMWPSDPYECPYCLISFSSTERLIEHFYKEKHPKAYIHQRFRIDLSKRKVKLHNATTSSNISTYKSPSVKAYSVNFEASKRKH